MSSTDQVRSLIDQAAQHFIRIDILVNNAGGVSAKLSWISPSPRGGD